MDLTKSAHADGQQKAVGCINAAGEALGQALWWLDKDSRHHTDVTQLLIITNLIKTRLTEEYDDG